MSEQTDEALMRALHEEHAAALWAFTLRLTGGDRARAEDVAQETLLRAWRHPSVLDQSARSARAWLFTVARRIVIDGWSSAASRAEVTTDTPPETAAPDDIERAVQGLLVADALAELAPRHREVISLCYYQGLSVAEAAARLGVAEGTVKSRVFRGRRELAGLLRGQSL